MIDYQPYHGGTNPDYDEDSKTLFYLKQGWNIDGQNFKTRIAEWANGILPQNGDNAVVGFAPGHATDSKPSWVYGVLSDPGSQFTRKPLLKKCMLIRTETVPKSATTNTRDQQLHKDTISIPNPDDIRGKTVYIIDDVWTSGATLRACGELAIEAGATEVVLAAVGKTVNRDLF